MREKTIGEMETLAALSDQKEQVRMLEHQRELRAALGQPWSEEHQAELDAARLERARLAREALRYSAEALDA